MLIGTTYVWAIQCDLKKYGKYLDVIKVYIL